MIQTHQPLSYTLTTDTVLDELYPGTAQGESEDLLKRKNKVSAVLETLIPVAEKHINTVGMYRILSQKEIVDWPLLKANDSAVLGLVTLGNDFDRKLSEIKQLDHMTQAVLFDTIGSVAIESACDTLDMYISSDLEQRGMDRTQRISPGIGCFNLADQEKIFFWLPAHTISVYLTSSFMMQPIKSISFVIAAGSKPVIPLEKAGCSCCGILNCRSRARKNCRKEHA